MVPVQMQTPSENFTKPFDDKAETIQLYDKKYNVVDQ